jgi:plastocyanin
MTDATHHVRQRPIRAVFAATLAGAALALTACSGGASSASAGGGGVIAAGLGQHLPGQTGASRTAPASAMPPMEASTSSAAPQGPAPGAAANQVLISNFAFAPTTLTVKVGTTVTWTNHDADAHTVTSKGAGPMRSAALNTGGSYSVTFNKPGTYAYYCQIHPFMTGSVTVTA